jgi:hypothetical protein
VPVASILSSYNKSIREINILSSYMNDCAVLESKYQYFVSEVVMLRLFAILELSISEMALRLSCGAPYKNGVSPITLVACTNISDANTKMISYNRRTPIRFLKWTSVSEVEKTIKYTLDLRDRFFVELTNHNSLFEEMRHVRNHIAHRNSGTAVQYYNQLHLLYGGNLRLSVGTFLTSTVRNNPSNIRKYLISVPIILHDISKG